VGRIGRDVSAHFVGKIGASLGACSGCLDHDGTHPTSAAQGDLSGEG